MLRLAFSAAAVVAALIPATTVLAEGASTVRIEPRPYYGAVVTVERGVRVWRPLPPTRHMIINPTNAPVSVNITDVRETVHHRHTGGGAAASASAHASGGGGIGLPGYYHGRVHRHPGRPVQGLSRHHGRR